MGDKTIKKLKEVITVKGQEGGRREAAGTGMGQGSMEEFWGGW